MRAQVDHLVNHYTWQGYVYDGARKVSACTHFHQSVGTARACAERQLRRALRRQQQEQGK